MDESEFSHIFSCDYNIFRLWDTDDNGLIDALEVFSGLILFTTAKYDEKIECNNHSLTQKLTHIKVLFNLFDFNEMSCLEIMNIEFLLNSCLKSTFKIFTIQEEVNTREISLLVNTHFNSDGQLNIDQFMEWSKKSIECQFFFDVIR